MRVLVTGGTGFIGAHVVQRLVARGDAVRLLVLPDEPLPPELAELDLEVVRGDLTDAKALRHALEGVEGLYHLAAIYAIWLPDPTEIYRVNVEGTRRLLTLALEAGIRKVVYTSSIAALGVVGDGTPATEATPFAEWRTANDYVLSKYMAELEVRALVARGLPAVIVNPAFPFGPGDRRPTPTGKLIVDLVRGRLRGVPPGGLSVVDVRDVAEGHLLAMDRGRVGEGYLLANPEGNMTFARFCRMVGRIAGVPAPTRDLPRAVVLAAARGMEAVARLRRRPPLTTYRTVLYTSRLLYCDPSKAVRELGLPQTPVEVALEDAVVWFRQHGYFDGA